MNYIPLESSTMKLRIFAPSPQIISLLKEFYFDLMKFFPFHTITELVTRFPSHCRDNQIQKPDAKGVLSHLQGSLMSNKEIILAIVQEELVNSEDLTVLPFGIVLIEKIAVFNIKKLESDHDLLYKELFYHLGITLGLKDCSPPCVISRSRTIEEIRNKGKLLCQNCLNNLVQKYESLKSKIARQPLEPDFLAFDPEKDEFVEEILPPSQQHLLYPPDVAFKIKDILPEIMELFPFSSYSFSITGTPSNFLKSSPSSFQDEVSDPYGLLKYLLKARRTESDIILSPTSWKLQDSGYGVAIKEKGILISLHGLADLRLIRKELFRLFGILFGLHKVSYRSFACVMILGYDDKTGGTFTKFESFCERCLEELDKMPKKYHLRIL